MNKLLASKLRLVLEELGLAGYSETPGAARMNYLVELGWHWLDKLLTLAFFWYYIIHLKKKHENSYHEFCHSLEVLW